ncbi:MAG: hypothetical protein IKD07_00910 [Clostridia bacterium]|nr:hypothetical protein [Clostridia bacterium]
MKKSVYSLVLTDDVVLAIDRLAYAKNTNRSNMINQILAEYVSYVTPEKRFHDIFDRISAHFTGQDSFKLARPSDSILSLSSALIYKYNPTVKYSVELYRDGDAIGEMRVGLRTQNSLLLAYLSDFYRLFAAIEHRYIGETRYLLENGRLMRELRPRRIAAEEHGATTIGEAIGNYIAMFDRSMKGYFSLLGDKNAAAHEIQRIYESYLKSTSVPL